MSGQQNAGLNFRQVGCFRSDYIDRNGNQWSVEVAGEHGVGEFVEARPVNCWVTPLTGEQAKEVLARMMAGESQVDKLVEPEQTPQVDKLIEPEQILPAVKVPALEVICTLVALAPDARGSEAYHVAFEIDPRMNAEHIPEKYGFQLKGDDTTAKVTFHSDGGQIRVDLSGSGSSANSNSGNDGSAKINNVGKLSQWDVTVNWVSGSPSYTLRGDIIVN